MSTGGGGGNAPAAGGGGAGTSGDGTGGTGGDGTGGTGTGGEGTGGDGEGTGGGTGDACEDFSDCSECADGDTCLACLAWTSAAASTVHRSRCGPPRRVASRRGKGPNLFEGWERDRDRGSVRVLRRALLRAV